jgi:hypothetical protein
MGPYRSAGTNPAPRPLFARGEQMIPMLKSNNKGCQMQRVLLPSTIDQMAMTMRVSSQAFAAS